MIFTFPQVIMAIKLAPKPCGGRTLLPAGRSRDAPALRCRLFVQAGVPLFGTFWGMRYVHMRLYIHDIYAPQWRISIRKIAEHMRSDVRALVARHLVPGEIGFFLQNINLGT